LSSAYSYYFFREDLRTALNAKLRRYLDTSGIKLPNLDNLCLLVDDPCAGKSRSAGTLKREFEAEREQVGGGGASSAPAIAGQSGDVGGGSLLWAKLRSGDAVVKELLSDRSGILENQGKDWMCFFTASHVLLPPGRSLRQAMPDGTRVQVNAR
jgi:hypothetical protein